MTLWLKPTAQKLKAKMTSIWHDLDLIPRISYHHNQFTPDVSSRHPQKKRYFCKKLLHLYPAYILFSPFELNGQTTLFSSMSYIYIERERVRTVIYIYIRVYIYYCPDSYKDLRKSRLTSYVTFSWKIPFSENSSFSLREVEYV